MLLLFRFIAIDIQHLTEMEQYEWIMSVCLLVVHNTIYPHICYLLFCIYFVHISNKLREPVISIYIYIVYTMLYCTVLHLIYTLAIVYVARVCV